MYKIHNYFKEIHVRIFYVIFSFLLTLSLSYYFVDQLFYILTNFFFEINDISFRSSASWVGVMAGAMHDTTPVNNFRQFIFTDVTEAFRTCISLSLGIAVYINIPFILYHIWAFFIPSLFFQERKVFSKFCFFFLFLYFAASFIIIYFIFPILWNFFLKFEITTEFLKIHCETRISSYISFIFKICLLSHIIFQIPFFSVLLVYFKFFSILDILEKRRFIYWCILLISALIAPPDLVIQSIITFFLIIFSEICFFFLILFTQYS